MKLENKLLLIEDRGQTNRVTIFANLSLTLTLTYDLDV